MIGAQSSILPMDAKRFERWQVPLENQGVKINDVGYRIASKFIASRKGITQQELTQVKESAGRRWQGAPVEE